MSNSDVANCQEIRSLLEELHIRQISCSKPESIHFSEEPVNCADDSKGILKYYTLVWNLFFVVIDISGDVARYFVTFHKDGKIIEKKTIQEIANEIHLFAKNYK
jgi:hypothetical protein